MEAATVTSEKEIIRYLEENEREAYTYNATTRIAHKMPFGKYKKRFILDVAEDDPGYLIWLWSNEGVLKKLNPCLVQFIERNASYIKKLDELKSQRRRNLFK
jgi:uncharacterized protein (DUF3820 family)